MKKKLLVVITAIALMTAISSQAVSAAPVPLVPSAADFAADCNDDGFVTIARDTTYFGGVGTIKRECSIRRAVDTTLEFNGTKLNGHSIIAINSAGSAQIRIIDSQFELRHSIWLTSGCCTAEWTGADESGGQILIRGSEITASHISLQISPTADGGYIWIRESSISSTNATPVGLGLSISVGNRGAVDVSDSKFSTLHYPAVLESKKGAKTYVRNSRFNRAPTVSTGAGGVCRVSGNTPSFSCAAP